MGGFQGRAIGPYHCPACLKSFHQAGIKDITIHDEVIDLVMGLSVEATCAEDKNRLARIASWFYWEEQRLWLKGDLPREVPPIAARGDIIVSAAKQLAYPGGDRLYHVLKPRFYWSGMRLDSVRVC